MADTILTAVAFIGCYYSYRALRAFRGDIMEKVFGLEAAAFSLVGIVSASDATADLLAIDLWSAILLRITIMISYGLVVIGLAIFHRWAGQDTAPIT